MKRHHDLGNAYARKTLIEAGLHFQRFSPLPLWWEAWWHEGKYDATDVA